MLLCLRVHNFAIISHLEVEFSAGLNVVTGETGAGKSILVDALALVLGDKSRAEHVRHGAQRAEVEALFAPPAALDVSTRAAQLGLEVGEELIVRRLIHKGGRSRAYINGQMVTREQLQQLTAGLTDICSQHAHHALVHASQHLHYLDAYARLETQRQEVGARVQALSEAHAALQALEARQATRHEREDFLRFQLHEIESLAPEPGEEEV
ncbi:MAG: AAA family ATPase, partial [Polyangiales bacterium]